MNERRKGKEKDERLFNGTAVNCTEKCTKKKKHTKEKERQEMTLKKERDPVPKIDL